MKQIAVLGTGMSGLGAGYVLKESGLPFTCYDQNDYLGGHTRSFRYDSGFVFDEGGHISFTKHEHVRDVLAKNIRGQYEERSLKIDNYWHGRRIPHPVQCNLRGLPSDLLVRVIEDFVATRERPQAKDQSYAEWLRDTYGTTFAETFPMIYGHKYHTTTMDRLTTDWIGPRMYRPSLEQVLRGAIGEEVLGAHYVDLFRYPSHGGFVSYLEPFAERFDTKLGHRVVRIDPAAKSVRFANGVVVEYERLISSIPLPDLIPLVQGVPQEVADAAGRLAFTQAVLINLGIGRSDLSESAITYFYDEDIIFSRVNLPHMFSPNNAPPGCGTIQAEIYFSDKYKPLRRQPHEFIEPVIADLRRVGFIRDDDKILLKDADVNRYANVIYDFDRTAALSAVHGFLDEVGIYYCGRYGDWNHAWTDEAFLSGEAAAKRSVESLR